MRSLLIQLLFVAACIPVAAQSKIDTLYYDRYGRGVDYKAFAEYIRVVAYYDDDVTRRPFRDFYLSGQLRAEGDYLEIDKKDDENSIFDKLYTEYYKSGQIKYQEFWSEGKRNGQYRSYYENGNIKEDAVYDKGVVNGAWLSYSEDGETCKCVEYENDMPKYDYYTLSTKSGLSGKFNIETDELIDDYIEPEYKDCLIFDVNDEAWSGYYINGLVLVLHVSMVKQYGKYYKVDIYLKNNTFKDLEFNFYNTNTLLVEKEYMITSMPYIYSSNEYLNTVRNRQSWNVTLLVALGGANRTYHTTSYTPFGTIKSTTTTTDSYKLDQINRELAEEAQSLVADYVKEQTLRPSDALFGFFLVGREPVSASILNLSIEIDGVIYPFQYDVTRKQISPRKIIDVEE